MIVADDAEKFDGWGDYHPMLILLWNCDAWVWKAIDHAIAWRDVGRWGGRGIPAPDQMIALVRPKDAR